MPDFDFKEKFPISSYIAGVLEKKKIEEASKAEGRRSMLAGLQSIGNVGQDIVDTRAADARALAQAQLLAGVKPELADAYGASAPVATRQGPEGQLPVTAGQTQTGRTKVISSLADSIKGITGDQLLGHLKPDTVDETIYLKDAKGNITGTQTRKVPKGSKSTVIGPNAVPNSMAGFQQSQYADDDGSPLNFIKATGQYLRPDGTPAHKAGQKKADESSLGDANLMANQLPNVDILFDAYKNKGSGLMGDIKKRVQSTGVGSVVDPAAKQAENSLKLAAFTFGGKNLTGQEKDVVFGALFPSPFDNDESRENKRALLKNFMTGKIDLLEAANLLGPAGNDLRKVISKYQTEADQKKTGAKDYSAMSDEELLKIASGKKP